MVISPERLAERGTYVDPAGLTLNLERRRLLPGQLEVFLHDCS